METLKFITSLTDKTLLSIRSALYNKGILANYNIDGRMILYQSKKKRFDTNDIQYSPMIDECNGLIIDTVNLKILAEPPHAFKSNINSHTVSDYLSKDLYDVYLIEDGTIINIYYWPPENSWIIATNRSYDNTHHKWGSLTYSEIVRELLNYNNINIDDFYNTLNKDVSYTFGIKHASMHPFREGTHDPINKLWFVQSSKNGIISYVFNSAFPIQTQAKLEFPYEITTNYLFGNLKYSFDDFIVNGNVLYGYILRSKNNAITGVHSNILLESRLLQKIRQVYYNSSLNNIIKEHSYDKELYTTIYAFLNSDTHLIYNALFPQFSDTYDKLNNITKTLLEHITKYSDKPDAFDKSNKLYQIIETAYTNINNYYKTSYHASNPIVVSKYLLNISNTDWYYNMIMNYTTLF
jgi:hypothetical protein